MNNNVKLKYLTSDSPFRQPCWAVIKNGYVHAYCFTAESAGLLERALNQTNKLNDGKCPFCKS